MPRFSHRTVVLLLVLACALIAAGCGGSKGSKGDSAASSKAGKKKFIATCGVCHSMADANTNGAVGPNLDDLQPTRETVEAQIENGGGGMPAGLLHGQDAKDVAAYVGAHAGK